MSRLNRTVMALVSGGLLTTLVLSSLGCTKAREQKSMVDPTVYFEKSTFTGRQFYFVRGIESTTDGPTGVVPGSHSDLGIVEARITETELQFIEVFAQNRRPVAQPIVTAYPIVDQFDINRERNDFGEETHRIIEDRRAPWQQRSKIRVDFSRPSNWGSFRIHSFMAGVDASRVVLLETPKMDEAGHFSFVQEVEFKPLSGQWWAEGARSVVRTHLMPVPDSDFEGREYSAEDFGRFGFFFTQQNVRDPEQGFLDRNIKRHANLHNVCEPGRVSARTGQPLSCSTAQIRWFLGEGYPERYRDIARQSVDQWNRAFKSALNRQDDVVVLDESRLVPLADPRFNVIGLYDEQSEGGGLLGLAQMVTDPKTGQIITARATTYMEGVRGVMGSIGDIIDLIVNEEAIRSDLERRFTGFSARQSAGQQVQGRLTGLDLASQDFMKGVEEHAKSHLKHGGPGHRHESAKQERMQRRSDTPARGLPLIPGSVGGSVRAQVTDFVRQTSMMPREQAQARRERLVKAEPSLFIPADLDRIGRLSFMPSLLKVQNDQAASRFGDLRGMELLLSMADQVRADRERNMEFEAMGWHSAEFVEEASLRFLLRLIQANSIEELAAQKDKIKEEVGRLTIFTTMLHEMGHALGLRHNFHGSSDAPNYHPEYFNILAKLEAGDTSVTPADLEPFMYTSVMDYSAKFYEQSAGLGPYDVAAIRYGYNRSIDQSKDASVQRRFKFCTDHQVGESILCRQFDKGRNVSEITADAIQTYENNYLLRNFRRGRADYNQLAGGYPMRMFRRMLGIRQVVDELVYQLVRDGQFISRAVKAGEVANVENPLEAERAGVDVTRLATFPGALFNPQTGQFRVIEAQAKNKASAFVPGYALYQPEGFGDLLFANVMAMEFFSSVIGSAEPGQYLPMPKTPGSDETILVPLPPGGTDEQRLARFAEENSLSIPPEQFAQRAKGLIVDVRLGSEGKVLMSGGDETSLGYEVQVIGNFWDKVTAMFALSTRDTGVERYAKISLSGNSYSFPFTRDYASELFSRLVREDKAIRTATVRTRSGDLISASIPAALNLDTQAFATMISMTDMVAEGRDESFMDKMRVCTGRTGTCENSLGLPSVSFSSASTATRFQALQTRDGDSISFRLVSEAAELDQRRNEIATRRNQTSATLAKSILALDEVEPVRQALLARTEPLAQFKDLRNLAFGDGSGGPQDLTVYRFVRTLASNPDGVPLFLTLNLAEQVSRVLGATDATIIDALAELGLERAGNTVAGATAPSGEKSLQPGGSRAPRSRLRSQVPRAPDAPAPGQQRQIRLVQNAAFEGEMTVTDIKPAESVLSEAGSGEVVPEGFRLIQGWAKPDSMSEDELRELRKVWVQVSKDFTTYAQAVTQVGSNVIGTKTAPIEERRVTQQLAQKEGLLRTIVRIMKGTGAE